MFDHIKDYNHVECGDRMSIYNTLQSTMCVIHFHADKQVNALHIKFDVVAAFAVAFVNDSSCKSWLANERIANVCTVHTVQHP